MRRSAGKINCHTTCRDNLCLARFWCQPAPACIAIRLFAVSTGTRITLVANSTHSTTEESLALTVPYCPVFCAPHHCSYIGRRVVLNLSTPPTTEKHDLLQYFLGFGLNVMLERSLKVALSSVDSPSRPKRI